MEEDCRVVTKWAQPILMKSRLLYVLIAMTDIESILLRARAKEDARTSRQETRKRLS